MNLWHNPIYRLESRDRGPRSWRDGVGWILGRGASLRFWRLVPVLAVGGSIAVSAASLPNAFVQAMSEFALWVSTLVLGGIAAALGSAIKTGRDWQEGRMDEWKMMPVERSDLVGGKVWGWVLPIGVALTAGWCVSAVVWWSCHRAGVGIPLFAPLEGALMVLDTWAVLLMCASVGVWAGNQTRRPWLSLVTSSLVCSVLLAAVVAGIAVSFDRALLGGHLIVIGAAWLVGSFFHGWSERQLR